MILAKTAVKTELVPLKSIQVDQAINPRAGGTSEETAQEYAAALESGDEFPPAVVYRDRQGVIHLSEGFTRHRAHQIRGSFGMSCIVRLGDRRDAALNAAASNQNHGQRRTNADKRKAVEIVLGIRPEWADNRIANHIGVSQPFVGTVRTELITVISSTRIGSDGRERSLPHTSFAHTGPAVSSPSKNGDLSAPNPRAAFEADVVAVCLDLATCKATVGRLAFTAFGGTIKHKKALAAIDNALALLWSDRPGKPPG